MCECVCVCACHTDDARVGQGEKNTIEHFSGRVSIFFFFCRKERGRRGGWMCHGDLYATLYVVFFFRHYYDSLTF